MSSAKTKIAAIIAAVTGVLFFWRKKSADSEATPPS